MQNAKEKCHAVFPYTNIENTEFYVTPNWIKYLHYQSHKLKNTSEIIRHYLSSQDYDNLQHSLHVPSVHHLILQDIDLSLLDPYLLEEIQQTWSEQETKHVMVMYHPSQQLGLFETEVNSSLMPDKFKAIELPIKIPLSISIRLFKQIMLNKERVKPFFLEYNLDNNDTVNTLI